MLLRLYILFAAILVLSEICAAETLASFQTSSARFAIDSAGAFSAIASLQSSTNYLAERQPAPVLSVRVGGKLYSPASAKWEPQQKSLLLSYGGSGVGARISIIEKPTHLVLTVAEVQPVERVELVLWGPYPTTIGEIIGDTVGVVRNRQFAFGLQALNAKTLGGYPEQENDVEQGRGGDDRGDYDDLAPELKQGQSYRGDTARGTSFGSVVQAYTRNRAEDRLISNWGHDKFIAKAFGDGGVVGSSIALFACPAAKALATIGDIEVAESLPHPMIDGVWGKISPTATASYLIVDFSENTVDRAIEMARRAGLRYVYHSSPFATWGHFQLKTNSFPHGWQGWRRCVEKAREAGIHVGFHTLSNFITPNDPYVTPIPDPRLAKVGSSELTAEIDDVQKEIPVATVDFFSKKTDLNTVAIGNELIRYSLVSTNTPWRLIGCERGAWGTRATSHRRGESVAKLMDHGYKVFLTDADLSREVAGNIAALFNETGSMQLSFDGLEGNWSTGLGQYGTTLFPKVWFDSLTPDLRGRVVNDASLPGHFNWHINTRMNWGEPWYAGFRESQTLYRFKNQVYFERNFLPRMLGWFALRGDTSLEDIEWMLARAAGYHAGFGLATSLASTAQLEADPGSADTMQKLGALPSILHAIRLWEEARLAGAFPPQIRTLLRENAREFRLAESETAGWDLYEVGVKRLTRDAGQNEPSVLDFEQPNSSQLQWMIRGDAAKAVNRLTLEIDGTKILQTPLSELPSRATLKYMGGPEAIIYDSTWKELQRVVVNPSALPLPSGAHRLRILCDRTPGAKLTLELRTSSAPTHLKRP